MSRDTILAQVAAERDRQADLYPPAHDDAHHHFAWVAIALRHLGLAIDDGGGSVDPARYERQMIRVAAVAVAALESAERKREAARLLEEDRKQRRWQHTADVFAEPILVLTSRMSHVYGVEESPVAYAVVESAASGWELKNYVMRIEPTGEAE